jgi:ABC-2 type transport system permease protein
MNNTGVIFKQALRDARRTIIGWGLGLATYVLFMVLIYPTMQNFQQLNDMLELPIFQAMVGTEFVDITSPSGYLGMYLFLYTPLLLAVFAILYGLGITAAEEDHGTLDVLLAAPIPRWQLIVEKFAAAIVIVLLILLSMLAAFVIGLLLTPALQVDWGTLILALVNALPITLLMVALTLLLSTIFRSRGLVGGILTVLIVASYFMWTLADLVTEPMTNMRYFSLFNYYNGATVLAEGVDWGGFALLSVVTAAVVGLSLLTFQRRDLGH